MHGTLNFGADLSYQQDADIPGHRDNYHVGDPSKFWLGAPNVLADLASLMTHNAAMRVLLMGGYFDLATPYAIGPFEIKHLPMDIHLQQNISYAVFPTGHEPYLNPISRQRMHDEISSFIGAASHALQPLQPLA